MSWKEKEDKQYIISELKSLGCERTDLEEFSLEELQNYYNNYI